MENKDSIERKKRNFIIVVVSVAILLSSLKLYSNYRLNKL